MQTNRKQSNEYNSKILITRPTQQNVSTSLYTKSHLIQFTSAPNRCRRSFFYLRCLSLRFFLSRRCYNGSMYFSNLKRLPKLFQNYLLCCFSPLIASLCAVSQLLSYRVLLSSLICVWAGWTYHGKCTPKIIVGIRVQFTLFPPSIRSQCVRAIVFFLYSFDKFN